jgi:hypothetical protein
MALPTLPSVVKPTLRKVFEQRVKEVEEDNRATYPKFKTWFVEKIREKLQEFNPRQDTVIGLDILSFFIYRVDKDLLKDWIQKLSIEEEVKIELILGECYGYCETCDDNYWSKPLDGCGKCKVHCRVSL